MKKIINNKKVFLMIVITCLFCFTLVSCNKEDIPPVDVNPPITETDETIEVVNDQEIETAYLSFFDISNKLTFEIIIDESELLLINEDYIKYNNMGSKSPIYRKCDLKVTFNNKTYYIKEVGIRMKGNTSRRLFYNEDQGFYNLVHFKLSFSETFDDPLYYSNPLKWDDEKRDIRKERTFLGMEKVDLKWNKTKDATYTREYYAYELYRNFGVLAPHSNLVNVLTNVNGEKNNLGVFFVIENIDKIFLKRNLEEDQAKGDLYKCTWGNVGGASLTLFDNEYGIGVEDEDSVYFPTYDLKTNKKKSSHSAIKNLLSKINNLNSDDFNNEIEELVDMDYFMSYEAVSYLLGNPDDLRNHYNNYYLYFLSDTNKAIIIPYDCDRTLGATNEWNPTNFGLIYYDVHTLEQTMNDGTKQINPLYTKTILNSSSKYYSIYQEKVISIVNNPIFGINKFTELFNKANENYQELTMSTYPLLKNTNISMRIKEKSQINSKDGNIDIEKYLSEKKEVALR